MMMSLMISLHDVPADVDGDDGKEWGDRGIFTNEKMGETLVVGLGMVQRSLTFPTCRHWMPAPMQCTFA